MSWIGNLKSVRSPYVSGFRKLSLLVIFTLLSLAPAVADPLGRFLDSGTVNPETCSVVIMDLASGRTMYGHNEDVPLIPASINKVVTIASLIEKSGTDYKYQTKVFADGTVKDGVLLGNLLVVGSGDPSLGAAVEPIGTDIKAEIVNALHDKGITSVTGDVVIDETIFPGPVTPSTWDAADLKANYGTGCHGLNYQRNASGKSSVANPAGVFKSQLKMSLASAGISVGNTPLEASGNQSHLLTHDSPPMDEIMRSCMMRSDNLYAEACMRTLALLCGRDATTANGASLEADYWRGKNLPMENVDIADGSGLSRSNRVTARFMAELLRYMAGDVDFVSFFPLAGEEGTMRHFLKDTSLDGYVAFKTGSMNGIQCYAGYLLDDDYAPTHVVVVMMNGFRTSRDAAKNALSKMLLEIFCPESSEF